MATRTGKTPSFPPYRLYSKPEKNLFLLEGHHVYDQDGCVYDIPDYGELCTFLRNNNALVFVEGFTPQSFPCLHDCITDQNATVSCTKKGVPTSCRISLGKNRYGKIATCGNWTNQHLTPHFLNEMEAIYEYCGVGAHATPAALGYALQLQSYTENELSSHFAPNRMAQKFLWKYHSGGRCDVMVPLYGKSDITYPITYELDMATAYATHFQMHPDKTSCSVIKEGAWAYATFFVECIVTIPHDLPLGPFPVRKERGTIKYPTKKGAYVAYLWREQIEDCLKVGCSIQIIKGYGWRTMTSENMYWSRDMYGLRQNAPNAMLESAIKSIIVAGIGRHGMHNRYFHLIDKPLALEDVCMVDPDTYEALPYFIHEMNDYTKPAMTHWYSYTLMETARSLYWHSVPYAENGTLLMTNYDALLIETETPPDGIVEKHSLTAKMAMMGDLRYQKLTNVKIHAARHLECDQKVNRPGIKKGRTA